MCFGRKRTRFLKCASSGNQQCLLERLPPCSSIACHEVCQAGRDSTACRPVLFLKPPSAAVFASAQNAQVPIELVKGKGSVHYEAEVVLRLNEALEVDAVTLGLDLTLRDLQAQIKKNGHPWEISKVQYLKWLPADIACF